MTAPFEPTDAELAAYIARMLGGLHEIAEPRRHLALLTHLIHSARQEAEARAKDVA